MMNERIENQKKIIWLNVLTKIRKRTAAFSLLLSESEWVGWDKWDTGTPVQSPTFSLANFTSYVPG